MNSITKYILGFAGIAAVLFLIVYGAYLPFQKANLYISALRQMASVHSVAEFETNFNRVFNFYSPIGEEEIAKFLSYDILNLISQGQSEEVVREIVRFIEPHLITTNVRHLLNGAHMYEIMWRRFGKRDDDFNKTESYYLAAMKIGPKLPPVLYALTSLYQEKGDLVKAKAVAQIILQYWPNDTRVSQFVQSVK